MESICNSRYGKYGAELAEASMRLLRQLSRVKVQESIFDFLAIKGHSSQLFLCLFETDRAKLAAGRGLYEKLIGQFCSLDKARLGEMQRAGKVWVVRKCSEGQIQCQPFLFGGNFDKTRENVLATLALPFRNEEKLIGVLGLDYEEADLCPDDERVWLLEQYAVWAGIAYENAGIFEGQQRELTRRRQLEEEIRHMAYHDALTGLPNRRLLEDRLNLAISQARRFDEIIAVMFLDLDGMKRINDSYGHEAGDLLLESVAARLCSVVRDIDTVARISGDEFVLVLPRQENRAMTGDLANRVLAAIRCPFDLGRSAPTGITASIGISFFPEDGMEYATLLRSADKAMYLAKQMGRDQWVVSPGNAVI